MPAHRLEMQEIRLLPDAPLSEATEFVFVGGIAFVNAAKHEEVVGRHVEHLRGAVEALREIEALGRTDGPAAPLLVRAGDRATQALDRIGRRS
jgi:hypothetical protein